MKTENEEDVSKNMIETQSNHFISVGVLHFDLSMINRGFAKRGPFRPEKQFC